MMYLESLKGDDEVASTWSYNQKETSRGQREM